MSWVLLVAIGVPVFIMMLITTEMKLRGLGYWGRNKLEAYLVVWGITLFIFAVCGIIGGAIGDTLAEGCPR